MTKSIPSYLRIHRDEDAGTQSPVLPSDHSSENCLRTFASATGWRINRPDAPTRTEHTDRAAIEILPAIDENTTDIEELPLVGRQAAGDLARAIVTLIDELDSNRQTLRRLQSESTMRAHMLPAGSDSTTVADQIEETLANAVAASRCDAALLFTLDDDTEFLCPRFQYGLAPKALESQPRQLKECRGDLEAMVQGIVTINDLTREPIDTWSCPIPCEAAICVVIQTDGVPTGTLWLLRNQPMDFGTAETAAARMAATQLNLLCSQGLEPVAQVTGTSPSASTDPIEPLSVWQFESLPIGALIAEDWRVDGMIESPRRWATGWHHWDVLPDGSLMIAIAEAIDQSTKGAMHAAIARAAISAHAGYRHTPAQLMQRISDTLWQTSSNEQFVSLAYARIDPESGEGEIASAGQITALIGNRYGYRPLADGAGQPLNSHIEARISVESFRLTPGETLLAYTPGIQRDGGTQQMLGEQIRSAMIARDEYPLAHVRRALATLSLGHERGAITLLRCPQ